jgi:hypothetical protein
LLAQVDDRRNPRTSATVAQLLERHLELLEAVPTTKSGYAGACACTSSRLIGSVKVGALDADMLDSFYAELRRCRDHCDGRPFVEHRKSEPGHVCEPRCRPHECRPLTGTTIRQIHFLLNGAFKRAVRWRWVAVNPIAQAEPPTATKPNPRPPTADEAARIVNAAWEDPDWGS